MEIETLNNKYPDFPEWMTDTDDSCNTSFSLPFPTDTVDTATEDYCEMEKRNEKIISFSKKLMDVKGNFETLSDFVSHNQTVLLEAPTGTGKTYTIAELFKANTFTDTNPNINILIVPTRSQALQVQNTYPGFMAIIGGSEELITYSAIPKGLPLEPIHGHCKAKLMVDLSVSNTFVVVLDKISTIENLFDAYEHENFIYNLVIDEAHKLFTAYNYRNKAILATRNFINKVQSKPNNKIIFMTATATVLNSFDKIDKKIIFRSKNKTANFENFEIIYNNENKPVKDKIYSIIRNEQRAGNKVLCRYNSKTDMADCAALLRKPSGKDKALKVLTVCSEDKKQDKDSMKYENEILECFINNSSLPDADVWFCTSMIDEGSNICSIEKLGQYESITCLFVVKDKRFLLLDDIVQFLSRIRYPYKKAIIFINKCTENEYFEMIETDELNSEACYETEEEKIVLDEPLWNNNELFMPGDTLIIPAAKTFFKYEKVNLMNVVGNSQDEYLMNSIVPISFYKEKVYAEAHDTGELIKHFINMEKTYFRKTSTDIIHDIENNFFGLKTIDDFCLGMDSFIITSDFYEDDNLKLVYELFGYNIYIDYYALNYASYTKYNQQFYNNTMLLSAIIREIFSIPDVTAKKVDLHTYDDDICTDLINSLLTDKEKRKEFYSLLNDNKLNEFVDAKGLLNTLVIKNICELTIIRQSSAPSYPPDVIVLESVKAVYEDKYLDFKKQNLNKIIKGLSAKNILDLMTSNIGNALLNTSSILSSNDYLNLFKKIWRLNVNSGDLEKLCKKYGSDKRGWNDYIEKQQVKHLNNTYILNSNYSKEIGVSGKEHYTILNHLYTLTPSGKMKSITVTKSIIEDIVLELNENFHKNSYTIGKVKRRIKKIFNCKQNKNGDLQLNYLYL